MRGEFSESNQTCQRGNQGADTPNVYTQKKLGIIVCELRKKNCRGNVTDDLAGTDGHQQSVLFQQFPKYVLHKLDTRHVACEDEKGDEGEQQSVIDVFKCLSVQKQQRGGDNNQPNPKGNDTEDDDDGQREKGCVNRRTYFGQSDVFAFDFQRLFLDKNQATKGN